MVELYLFVLKILSGNKILTSIKGCNSFTNLQKVTGNNPNLDLVNINVCNKFGQIPFIHSQEIGRKTEPRNHGITDPREDRVKSSKVPPFQSGTIIS